MFDLTFEEQRVLGCLLEKEIATPEYYPLTLNSLVAACNQKTSRDPMVEFDGDLVDRVVGQLRDKGLAILVHEAGARVPKFKHRMRDHLTDLSRAHFALLCVLLLRGQQTVGELRTRTDRLFTFADLSAVEEALEYLTSYEPSPLVKEIPPGRGRHVRTFVHLLGTHDAVATPGAPHSGAEADEGWGAATERIGGNPTTGDDAIAKLNDRVTALEAEVAALRSLLDDLTR